MLRRGGVVAYPTEGVYGLGCDPLDAGAAERLAALKGRPRGKGLIVIAAHLDSLRPLLAPLPPDVERRVGAAWPGPVTWVLPAAPGTPAWLTGGRPGLAVRVTAHPLAAALCRAVGGPIVSTSANRSGRRPARTALAVRRAFGAAVDVVLSGPLGGSAGPSEIRDAASGRVVRPAAG